MKKLPQYPVGLVFDVSYAAFDVTLSIESIDRLSFSINQEPYTRQESVAIEVIPLGNNLFIVSWVEKDGATVVNLQDFDAMRVLSFATLPNGTFLRNQGAIRVRNGSDVISDYSPHRNSRIVLDAMTSLFQRRDVTAVERLYTENYIQHNPTIEQGRNALQAIVAGLDDSVFYEPGMILAQDDMVAIHGRIRGWGPKPQVVVDMFRLENGKLAEHWDVLQDEVAGGIHPMFDPHEGVKEG